MAVRSVGTKAKTLAAVFTRRCSSGDGWAACSAGTVETGAALRSVALEILAGNPFHGAISESVSHHRHRWRTQSPQVLPLVGLALRASMLARQEVLGTRAQISEAAERLDPAAAEEVCWRLSTYLAEDESSGARIERSRLRAPRRPIRLSSRRDAKASI